MKGKPCHHTEYVIYEKRRILIEYVAYYQGDKQFSSEHSSSSGPSESDSDSNSESDDEGSESFLKKQQVG